jgi:hypothetical protein
MAAMMRGALGGPHQQLEDMCKLLNDNNVMVANHRVTGTQQEVFAWYRDAINNGITKLNDDGARNSAYPVKPFDLL